MRRPLAVAAGIAGLLPLLLAPGVRTDEGELLGRVMSGGRPVEGALVRLQATDAFVVTDAAGEFALPRAGAAAGAYVTAAKEGYYNRRAAVGATPEPLAIELVPIPADDPAYAWQDPRPDPTRENNCGNCHGTIFGEWSEDAHSRSVVNPLVRTMYDGTDVHGTPNVGPGYRLDWPDLGNCARCHAPLAARGAKADLGQVAGVETTGVSCDFCHKVQEVALDPRFPAAAEFVLRRPPPGHKLIFGPFDDATFPGEVPDFSYSPLFASSRICAPCHDGSMFGVPVYETFSEWSRSEYGASGVACQHCHMRSTGETAHFADPQKGGLARAEERIGSHRMMGADREAFLRSAVAMETTARAQADERLLEVRVVVANIGAGHHLPTGQPMRHLLLVVSARDGDGRSLRLLAGERVPPWGADYAGEVGKAFAKVLLAASEYRQTNLLVDERDRGADFPAPFWRRSRVLSDNRIPARGSDASSYLFELPPAAGEVRVEARLVYRRAYKALAEIKGWELPDVVLGSDELTVRAEG